MSFNPFSWNNTQPSSSQNISTGQTTILQNMNFLGSTTGLGASNSSTGFIQFPNGLIVQWGLTGSLTGDNNAHSKTFAGMGLTAFPSYCFAVFFQSISSSLPGKYPILLGPGTLTKTGFDYYIQSGSSYSAGAHILAIGV